MTKPIIVVKMPCKLLYVIQVKGFLIKCSTSWPYLHDIRVFGCLYLWLQYSFLQPGCFCLVVLNHDAWAFKLNRNSYSLKLIYTMLLLRSNITHKCIIHTSLTTNIREGALQIRMWYLALMCGILIPP